MLHRDQAARSAIGIALLQFTIGQEHQVLAVDPQRWHKPYLIATMGDSGGFLDGITHIYVLLHDPLRA